MIEEEIDTTECVRCYSSLSWEGDPPDDQSDVLCCDCVWTELVEAREQLDTIKKALKDIDLLTCARSDCKELAVVVAGLEEFRCGMHASEGMNDMPQAPLVRWLATRDK